MPTSILPKFSAAASLTISLGGLANTSSRQSTIVDNSASRHQRVYLYPSIKLGATPTANTLLTLWLIRDDGSGTPVRTDGAGALDAAIVLRNAISIGSLTTGAAPATGDVLRGDFVVESPGPKWGVAVTNSSGVALDATNGNHAITWVGESPEVQ